MEKNNDSLGYNRRRFLFQFMPACSLVCLGASRHLFSETPWMKQAARESKHKFDQEFPRKLTSRQFMEAMYGREFIPFVKMISAEIGEEKIIPLLEKYAEGKAKEIGAMVPKQFGGNDFATWKKLFSPDNPNQKISLSMTIAEESDTVYELKVTECLWADVFLKADAGKIGHAAVCHGDYAMASAFNPKLKMVRDKTLMQGHDCCNHRYLFSNK